MTRPLPPRTRKAIIDLRQAEWTAPRRETPWDYFAAFVTWVLCLGALVTFYLWVWSVVA